MNYLKLFGIAAFAIGAILYMASADDHDLVMGDQDYELGEYVKISVNLAADIGVQVDDDYAINVRADEMDLKNLKIYVKGQTLVIERRESLFKPWHGKKPNIMISLPKLKKITLNSSADIDIDAVHGRYFKAVVNGSGSIDFTGKSDELVAVVNGSGEVNATSYEATETSVNINGSGEVALAGSCETLTVEVNGSGNLAGQDYICEMVEVEIMGSGDSAVYARDMIEVDVMGSGEVTVYGKPDKVIDRSRKKNHILIH